MKFLKKQLGLRGSVLKEAILILRECLTQNLLSRFWTLNPTVLQLNVNARCNAKCGMCNIWQTENPTQISLQKFEQIFKDPLFQGIEYVCVSGGEPTLRRDLPDVISIMMEVMPLLRQVSIPTTGIATGRSLSFFSPIAKECFDRKVGFSIGISLDGVGEVFDQVRGVPGGYQKVITTILALKKLNQDIEFSLHINPTITALNVYDCYNLVKVSRELEIGINFVMGIFLETYYRNTDLIENLSLTQEAAHFLRIFLREQIKQQPIMSKEAYYYEKVLEMMDGAKRSLPCPYQDQGLVIDHTGDVSYCINSQPIGNLHDKTASSIYYNPENLHYRRKMKKEMCPDCKVSCFVGVGMRKSVFPFLNYLTKRTYQRMLAKEA